VIIPVRNEARFIRRCLEAVLGQDYPSDRLEVLVVDGCSTDGSPDIVRQTSRLHGLRLLVNPTGGIPDGLNRAIRTAHGEVIVRVDAHTIIERDYVSQCVAALQRVGADVVGGPPRNLGEGFWGTVIAAAMASPFGRPARFNRAKRAQAVDTVYMGAFRRDTLLRAGLYDESIQINEDYELNYRIRRAGGLIYHVPSIRSSYQNRRSLGSLWMQFWRYGRGKGTVLRRHPGSLQLRHLAAPLFVLALAGGLAFAVGGYPTPVVALLGLYGVTGGIFARRVTRGAGVRHSAGVLIAFSVMHLSWGAGVWAGLVGLAPLHAPEVGKATVTC
jgi:glycosyltransferase involved in cell wall biosynthesis